MTTLAIICAVIVAFIAFLGMFGYFDNPKPKKTGTCMECGEAIDVVASAPNFLCDECYWEQFP